jgi:hypothetical protein
MGSAPLESYIERFVFEVLRTGVMLSNLVADLSAALPDDAYPGEEPETVILEMLCGTISTVLKSADPAEVHRATELIDMAATRTVEHLRLAASLSRRIHGRDGGTGRAYG